MASWPQQRMNKDPICKRNLKVFILASEFWILDSLLLSSSGFVTGDLIEPVPVHDGQDHEVLFIVYIQGSASHSSFNNLAAYVQDT